MRFNSLRKGIGFPAGWLIRRFALPLFTFEQEGRARLMPSRELFLSAIAEFIGKAANN